MNSENINILKDGGVGVIPTDTIYGIVGSAFDEKALARLFKLKGRDEDKPPVVIISEIGDLEKFGAKVSSTHLEFMKKYWPGKVTIIFEISPEFKYLDKGKGLAIRFPNDKNIQEFLKQTGPLATSSANMQGQPPAKNITEARKYFGDKVDFYQDSGNLDSLPSTLVKINDDKIEVLREGVVKIN